MTDEPLYISYPDQITLHNSTELKSYNAHLSKVLLHVCVNAIY